MNVNDYWKAKYLKYKKKNLEYANINLVGGDDKKKYIKILYTIKEKLKTKGYVFWFDTDGNVISKGLDTKSAKAMLTKKILENKTDWKNKIVTELVIEFDQKNIMDENTGGLSISVDLNKIVFHGDKLSIQMKNKNNSLFSLCYKYDELHKFKLSDLKKISLFVSNETLKKIGLKVFHYENIAEHIDQM